MTFFVPLSDFIGLPRHPGRTAILGECPSGATDEDSVDGGGGGAEPGPPDDVESAVGPELRHLQRREQRTQPAGTDGFE